jgi:hypothetical protein
VIALAILELADGTRYPAEAERRVEVERIRANAVLPAPRWVAIDPAGHEHRWVDGALPTLRADKRHVPCDGTCGNWDCDGYPETVHHCRECGAAVEPGYIPDTFAREVGLAVAETIDYEVRFEAPGWIFGGLEERPDGSRVLTSNALDAGIAVDGAHLIRGENREPLPKMFLGPVEWSNDGLRYVLTGSEMRTLTEAERRSR